MTKFSRVLKVTLQKQLAMLTRTILIYLLVVAVSFIFSLFISTSGKYWSTGLMGNVFAWTPIFIIVYLVRLILLSKNQMKSNSFRLIPISTNKLYLANILGVFISLLYVQIIHSIFIILSVVLGFFTIPHAQISGFYWRQVFTPQTINASLGGLLLGMLSPILIVILVHLIDFFSTVILKYIPGGAQRFVRVIVYIIVIALVIYILSNISGLGISIVNGSFLERAGAVWLVDGEFIIFVILAILINLGLLRSVETIR